MEKTESEIAASCGRFGGNMRKTASIAFSIVGFLIAAYCFDSLRAQQASPQQDAASLAPPPSYTPPAKGAPPIEDTPAQRDAIAQHRKDIPTHANK